MATEKDKDEIEDMKEAQQIEFQSNSVQPSQYTEFTQSDNPQDSQYNKFILQQSIPKSNDWFVVDKSRLQSYIQTKDSSSVDLNQNISEIDSSQLDFESSIGNGSFGQVWKGKWRSTQVAIKQIPKN